MGNSYRQYLSQKVKSLHVGDRERRGVGRVLAINRVIKEEWRMWQMDGLTDNVKDWRIA